MRKVTKVLGTIVISSSLVLAPAAQAAQDNKNTPLLVGPPVTDIVSPYQPALECIRQALTAEQKNTTFTVMSFVDKSGKTNYVSDSGTGMFSSQGTEDMIYTSLGYAGVQVTDMSPMQRSMMDWSLQKLAAHNASASVTGLPRINVGFKFPDVSISGAITTFDINMSSGGFGVKIAGIGAGRHKARILVGMDARLVEMAGGQRPNGSPMEAGRQAAVARISKQIVGYENSGGATGFFGGGAGTLIEFDLGTRQNEAIQYMERIMADGLVARLLTQYFGITACDAHIAYGDKLLVPPEPVNDNGIAAATPVAATEPRLATAN
jgi:curli biogenesis system outer membrane secretion channel CsgG